LIKFFHSDPTSIVHQLLTVVRATEVRPGQKTESLTAGSGLGAHPRQDMLGTTVNAPHLLDLIVAFRDVILID
jgi:hypothetical protein